MDPYGPYVQLGESTKRKAIPKGTNSEEINLDFGLRLLAASSNIRKTPRDWARCKS